MSRLFILDCGCFNAYGHNLMSNIRYADCLSRSLHVQSFVCVSRLLSVPVELHGDSSLCFLKSFHHVWLREMPVSSSVLLDDQHARLLACKHSEYLASRRELAIGDLQRLIDENDISESDILFYPNIDHVSLYALSCLLQSRRLSSFPRIAVRFIGVLEFPVEHDVVSLEPLICSLAFAAEAGHPIVFSAESAVMARRLSELYGIHCAQTPTLSDFTYLPLMPAAQFNVFAPGSGRPDKGFFRLSAICRHLSDLMSRPFTLFAQDMPAYRYQKLLPSVSLPVDVPEVVMLPSELPASSLLALMQTSHVVILPYESSVYQYRSSAIMADAACIGRSIVASGGCGFSEDIERFDLGFLAYSDAGFAERIAYLSERVCSSTGSVCMEKASSSFASYSHRAIVDHLAELLR